jgi:hypothetical protein
MPETPRLLAAVTITAGIADTRIMMAQATLPVARGWHESARDCFRYRQRLRLCD